MIKRLPLIPTLLVALAVATMIALGLWQIRRAAEKNALIARHEAARSLPATAFPTTPMTDAQLPLFRRATGYCLRPTARRRSAGQNDSGDTGYVHILECSTGAEGPGMAIELGWSRNPNAPIAWRGGEVAGRIVPDRKMRLRLKADAPAAGLQASREQTPAELPNNHRSYAVQWFLFAGIALIIYGLALRQRLRATPAEPRP